VPQVEGTTEQRRQQLFHRVVGLTASVDYLQRDLPAGGDARHTLPVERLERGAKRLVASYQTGQS
jgi:hypothetical protein